MTSFRQPGLAPLTPTLALAHALHILGEHQGKQELHKQQDPQALQTLRQAAIIQSTESSNRIEGVTAPPKRIQQLVAEKITPKNRSEQEIAGYRDVLTTVHTSAADMPFTVSTVRQMHRDLFQYTVQPGGEWKAADNDITETYPDGTQIVRFRPVPAFLTDIAMRDLHHEFNARWHDHEIDRLLLIPAYVLDFLCIHPFRDGNGRMARLLTLLLYQAGVEVGRFISLERIVEKTKESYYETLYKSSQGWHQDAHTLLPWTEYTLGVLLAAYRDFEDRVGAMKGARGSKTQMVRDAIARLPDRFRIADLQQRCPNVSREMIRYVLNELKPLGLHCEKPGAGAVWRKSLELTAALTPARPDTREEHS